jgi:acyl carrier protein
MQTMQSQTLSERNELVDTLKSLLKRQQKIQLDVDAISDNTRIDRIGFDSLSILDFMYDVEDHFKIRAEPADLVQLETVADLVDYLERKLAR